MATTYPQLQPISPSALSPPADCAAPESQSGLLSRSWVPPARPKPGRKPATDTPPSKRKAQNRLAQRNFRERRAAKVSELEDQMQQLETGHEAQMQQLESELTQKDDYISLLKTSLETDRRQLQELRYQLEHERRERQVVDKRLAQAEYELQKAGIVPLPGKAGVHTQALSEIKQGPASPELGFSTCEKCTEQRCVCIESILDEATENPKRPPSPKDSFSNKRVRVADLKTPDHGMEIDLTTRPKLSLPIPSTLSTGTVSFTATSGPPMDLSDSCGFCEDNRDVCVCRMSVQEPEKSIPDPIDFTKSVTSPARPSNCTGRPGSCTQCQQDPKSADFCRSFARANAPPLQDQDRSKGCGLVDCCRFQQPISHVRTGSSTSRGGNAGGMSYDCATTYQKLSEHPNFDKAMKHKDRWMPRLHSVPVEPPATLQPAIRPEIARKESLEGRPAYEIEAASVMSTIKFFNKEFGAEYRDDWKRQD